MVSAAANSVNHSLAFRCETPAGFFQLVPIWRISTEVVPEQHFPKERGDRKRQQESGEDGASTGLATESLVAGRGMQTLSGSTFETRTLRRFSYHQFGNDQDLLRAHRALRSNLLQQQLRGPRANFAGLLIDRRQRHCQ